MGIPPDLAILIGLLEFAIMISLLITGPGFLSIEKNLLKREMFPKSPNIRQQQHKKGGNKI